MNIFRFIDTKYTNNLFDLEYIHDNDKQLKCVDLRVYPIINNVIGEILEVDIVQKIYISYSLLEILKEEINKNEDV
jgi:exosortase/archaeosortase